jgi:hypothetical protein
MKKTVTLSLISTLVSTSALAQVFNPNLPPNPGPYIGWSVAIAASKDQKIVTVGSGYGLAAAAIDALEECSSVGGTGCWLVVQSNHSSQCIAVASDPNLWVGAAIWGDSSEVTAKTSAMGHAVNFCSQYNGGITEACVVRKTACNHTRLY